MAINLLGILFFFVPGKRDLGPKSQLRIKTSRHATRKKKKHGQKQEKKNYCARSEITNN